MGGSTALLLWIARRSVQRPVFWLSAAGLGGLWTLSAVVSPIGLTTRSGAAEPVVYELAFLAALAGTWLALDALEEARWCFELVGAGRRFVLGLAILLAGGAAGLVAGAILPAAALGVLPPAPTFVASALLCLTQLAALGLWIRRLPGSTPLRGVALPLVAWLLPAITGSTGRPGRLLEGVADASRHFAHAGLTNAGLTAILPILGLLAGAALFDLGYPGLAVEVTSGSTPSPPQQRAHSA